MTAKNTIHSTWHDQVVIAPGVILFNADNLSVTEGGAGLTSFQVALSGEPTADVVITLKISDTTEGLFVLDSAEKVSNISLLFTADNWNAPQNITLVAVDDKLTDGNIGYQIGMTSASEDLRFDNLLSLPNITVTTVDNEVKKEIYGDTRGFPSDDLLIGGDGPTDVYGLNGNDTLQGGSGNDRLYGDYGDDVLYGEDDSDQLEGDQGNDKLFGGSGSDKLTGGTGLDSLYGGEGDDTLDGSSGADFLDGGNGADTYYADTTEDIISDSGTDKQIDTLYITAYIGGGIKLGAGVDKGVLTLAAGDAALTGNRGSNTLVGNDSNNTLDGGKGDDTLIAGAGNDTLVGAEGGGTDHYDGGLGSDTVSYGSATGAITVDLGSGTATGAALGSNTLVDIENVTSGKGADALTGSSANNSLSGGDGSDTLDGGAGNDVLNGGAGSDIASYASATSAITVSLSVTVAQNTGGAGTDTLTAIESVAGSKYSDKLYGSNAGNGLSGGAGNDSLSGGGGNDALLGGAGNDVLVGGTGKDSLVGGAGSDTFDFNALTELGLGSTARDVITDFAVAADKIDLSTIDADSTLAGDQAFTFVSALTELAGQVSYSDGIISLNTDSDAAAEYEIQLTGTLPASLTAASFIL